MFYCFQVETIVEILLQCLKLSLADKVSPLTCSPSEKKKKKKLEREREKGGLNP